jgi:hypothetical protein
MISFREAVIVSAPSGGAAADRDRRLDDFRIQVKMKEEEESESSYKR